tara:strand:- start:211 stop:519 length:309 start_codon:yes stop_codon:yes gene_type:complete
MTIVKYYDGNPLQFYKEYKVPKLSTKTFKGSWLTGYVNAFFKGTHDYTNSSKVFMKIKNCQYSLVNKESVLVKFFKNIKKLKKENFEGEVFAFQLSNLKEAA